jgi:hypothetical protein
LVLADPIRRHAPPPSFPEPGSLRKPQSPANLVSQKTPFLRLLR